MWTGHADYSVTGCSPAHGRSQPAGLQSRPALLRHTQHAVLAAVERFRRLKVAAGTVRMRRRPRPVR